MAFWNRRKPPQPQGLTASALDQQDDEARYKPISLKMIVRIMSWLKPYKWTYAAGISMGVLMVALNMTGPQFIAHLSDYATAFLKGKLAISQGQAIWHIIWIILVWAAIIAVVLTLDRFRIIMMVSAGERVQFDLRRKLFEHLQRLSMSFYDKTKLGRIISRCTSDVGSLRDINVWGIDAMVINGVAAIAAPIALAFMTNWRLFLAVVWLGPVIYFANRFFLLRIGAGWQLVREGYTRVSTNLAENITGVRVVTAFNRQDPNLDLFNRLQVQNTANNIAVSRLNGLFLPALSLTGFLGKVIILAYGGYLVIFAIGRVSVGNVIAAWIYWDWFMGPVQELGRWYTVYMQAMAGGERVLQLLDTKPDVTDIPDAKPLPRIVGRVEFDHVTFGYKPEVPILHDVCFAAEPGQTVALVGSTGSGKSSIISLIARFYQPQQGRILVDGHDIRHVTGESLHKQMGLVLQVNYLFAGSVLDNIRYVRPAATREEILAASQALGTYDAIMVLKDGFDTEVGERGANMSVGQRQLICFTRAFLADPRIFMLDEATSAVDTATELLVQHSLEKLLADRTTFIVAHRLSTIMRADCILVIDQGKIIERGTHSELIEFGGKYAQLYDQFVAQVK